MDTRDALKSVDSAKTSACSALLAYSSILPHTYRSTTGSRQTDFRKLCADVWDLKIYAVHGDRISIHNQQFSGCHSRSTGAAVVLENWY